MLSKRAFTISVLCGGLALAAGQSASPVAGQWTIFGPPIDGKVHLTLRGTRGTSGQFNSSWPAPLDQFRGLTRAQMDSPGANVRFELPRDPGAFVFNGYFKNGNGIGEFTFSPNPAFVSEMQSHGYTGLTADTAFAMAIHNVTLAYARDLRALAISPVSSDQLIAMHIHGVAIDFIRDLRALGYDGLSADKLVAMRIHGVTTAFARELKSAGYNCQPDQMVALRIHGADTDFVKRIQALGYKPTVDQLVAMRIHGVTPEFIQDLEGRGLKKLSVDQLVSLRIHGID